MALDPQFASTPVIGKGNISTANTNRTATGTIVSIFTAGVSGSLIRRVNIQATGTTTAGMVRLWLFDSQGTPVGDLWREVVVTAITASGTVAAFSATVTLFDNTTDGMALPAGWSIRASTHNAEAFNVIVEAGNL